MSKAFSELISSLREISYEDFLTNLGRIDSDVTNMLKSKSAEQFRQAIRNLIEERSQDLYRLDFGNTEKAPELLAGEVAAVDGALALPMQQYSIGQAICVAVGSATHRRPFEKALAYWSAGLKLEGVLDPREFLEQQYEFVYGLSQTAVLRYCETLQAAKLAEPYVFLDGPIVYEWLAGLKEPTDLYRRLLREKKVMGVMKDLRNNKWLQAIGSVLKSGELFVVENLAQHLEKARSSNRNPGERGTHALDDFLRDTARFILRGVFKPRKQAYGFEVHTNELSLMSRLPAADCQMNHVGHEIPYLLNQVDYQIKQHCGRGMLEQSIAQKMYRESEELFFGNIDEHDFR